MEVKKNNAVLATFTFDADGKRVKSIMGAETILFVGAHYEIKNGSEITKYYFAGSTRIAMRKYQIPQPMMVEYMLSDHLGSTSLTADANGNKVLEIRYKAWGEIRATWTSSPSTTPAYKMPLYQYTGQASYMDDPLTSGVTEGFGLMFYNARWYDPYLNHFVQADTIVAGGTQGLDRYTYVQNNPLLYVDPSGHCGIVTDENGNESVGDLDCTADDIANWSMEYRLQWFQLFAALLGNDADWFNNIVGILQAFDKYGYGETATGQGANDWVSWTDAGILVSIQDGYNGVTEGAAGLWQQFFAGLAPANRKSDAQLKELWGKAEAAGTSYGESLACDHGHCDAPDNRLRAFLGVGDAYRGIMGIPYGGEILGGSGGLIIGGYAGFRACGIWCGAGGALIVAGIGVYGGNQLTDPRTMIDGHPPVFYVADAIFGAGR